MSAQVTRKERVRKERECLIIEQANDLLVSKGYIGFNLDELAERIEYSKGTLYQHFKSKEDIILAVVIWHLETRVDLFSRAAGFEGRTREKISGVGMADQILSHLYPHAFALDQLVQSPSVWEKASQKLKVRAQQVADEACLHCQKVIDAAFHADDLDLQRVTGHEIMAGLIGLSKGAHLLSQGQIIQYGNVHRIAFENLSDNYRRYLDGCGWLPLSSEWDYQATAHRLRQEVFSTEIATIQNF
ncbi:MAG: TetR/AcrR family transcriptional regulator [Verrucomicrobiota bacterium]